MAGLPDLSNIARVTAKQHSQLPSPSLDIPTLVSLLDRARNAVHQGASGVVVSQGTDTIEETAYLFDLLWDRPEPIVMTGAMRNPSLVGGDGPANLLAAIQVAGSEDAVDRGVHMGLMQRRVTA